jgi:hypothetical protein
MTYAVKLPRVFFFDHESRCIGRDVETRSTSKGITAELEGREVADLLSDAEYWSTEWTEYDSPSALGLGSSARATAAAIRRQFDADTLAAFYVEWDQYQDAVKAARVEGVRS